MNWTKDRSITLSLVCVVVFAVLLLAVDIFCLPLVRWFVGLRLTVWQQNIGTGMIVTVYLCSVAAWAALWGLWGLLRNLRAGQVFIPANVKLLRLVSWCCVGAAVVCLVSMLWYLPFVFVAIAAGFMALIVRIVKNVFQQAIAMKDELDLTI